jgi:hypothetical protein
MARKKSSSSAKKKSSSSRRSSSSSSKKSSSSRKKSSGRKYSKGASKEVETEMRHMKQGKHSKKHPIKSRKQAIAVGLSKARKKGEKVPKKKAA